MGLFSAIVKTTIETVKLPVAVVADAVTLCNVANGKPYTVQQLENIKDASEDL